MMIFLQISTTFLTDGRNISFLEWSRENDTVVGNVKDEI
jgi:hypothetical protein